MNTFPNFKRGKLDSGELSPRSWHGYKEVTNLVVRDLDKGRLVGALQPEDFSILRRKVAKKWGVYGLSRFVHGVRCLFKQAFESRSIDRPFDGGPQKTAAEMRRLKSRCTVKSIRTRMIVLRGYQAMIS